MHAQQIGAPSCHGQNEIDAAPQPGSKSIRQEQRRQPTPLDLLKEDCQFRIDAPVGQDDDEIAFPQLPQVIGEKEACVGQTPGVQTKAPKLDDEIGCHGA